MGEMSSSRTSLTKLLKKIQDKTILLENSPNPNFTPLSHPLVNPYPEWIKESKAWGIF